MKKLIAMSFLLGLGSLAQAAFIQCVPGQSTVVDNAASNGAQSYTCNPGAGVGVGSADDNLSGDGWSVTSIRLRVSGTFQENNGPVGQGYQVSFTSANGQGYNSPSCTTPSVPADANNQALGNCIGTGSVFTLGSAVDVISSFIVTVTGGPGSSPLPFNASASVFYEVTAVQDQAPPVPEPTTSALMAAGLLGFAFLRRRS